MASALKMVDDAIRVLCPLCGITHKISQTDAISSRELVCGSCRAEGLREIPIITAVAIKQCGWALGRIVQMMTADDVRLEDLYLCKIRLERLVSELHEHIREIKQYGG